MVRVGHGSNGRSGHGPLTGRRRVALIAENAASGRRRVRWRKTATAASALGLAVLIWASWALRFVGDPKNSSVPLDIGLYFWPIYETTYGRIAKGLLPLWNPYQLCGLPWVATLQGGFFYPPHVLFLFLPVRVSMAVSGVAHLIFAALTTLAFARRAGLSYAAAVLAAVLFTVRGQMADAVSTPNFLEAAAA